MRHINKTQIFIGVVVLFLGSIIYLVDRPPEQTHFVKSSPVKITLFNTIPNVFGSIGGSLPECIHVFSFILITAGLLFSNRRGYLIICLSWFLLDAAFEVGQYFSAWSSKIIPDWFTRVPFMETTKSYFLHGTFDFIDLAAIGFGTMIAYVVLLTTQKRRALV